MMKEVDEFLIKASVKGYRTLLMAMRVLDEEEIKEFMESCERAESNLLTKDKELQNLFDVFESNLVLLGATCVEDRL
jgi:magnesium-transporting ATPase (P-type)